MEYNEEAHQAWLDQQSGADQDPEQVRIAEALEERRRWLAEFELVERDMDDDVGGEFIISEGHKIRIPHHLQSRNIYN